LEEEQHAHTFVSTNNANRTYFLGTQQKHLQQTRVRTELKTKTHTFFSAQQTHNKLNQALRGFFLCNLPPNLEFILLGSTPINSFNQRRPKDKRFNPY